jgi:NAD(P)-dependent dehydrogenase (short-subunit alcohol dehydrogenase family)
MLLEKKNAIIYGAGGGIGGGVARTFAREGARVFLAGRTRASLEAVADDIAAAGGSAEVADVDALDERAVDEHLRSVVAQSGSVDVSFNLISRGDVQGTPLVDTKADDLARAVTTGLTANFHTARAAARHMIEQGSGVILSLTSGTAAPGVVSPLMGSTGPADAVIETFMRYLAAEVGPHGVRVVGLYTAGVPETLTREKLASVNPAMEGIDPDFLVERISELTMLRRAPRLGQVADAAAFLASDRAGAVTGTIVNVTSGLVPG